MSATDISMEDRREAVRRVLTSSVLEKSTRLKDLLSFLAERSLEDANASIPEQEIGIAVFGRKDYHANQDNLVRVHATQLRKKLDQYYSTEGLEDPVVFEIPRGGYALKFQQREAPARKPKAPGGLRRWHLAALATVVGAGLVAAGWVGRGWTLQVQPAQPTVRKLWSQFFANGLETHLVLADANVTVFQDFVKQSLGMRTYGRSSQMQAMVEQRYADPELRKLVMRVAGKYFVTLADAAAARKVETFGLPPGLHMRYGFARGFAVEHLLGDNAILFGNRRANPWIELFERQLRFRFEFDEEKVASRFEDTQAGPKDPRAYPTLWERESHCQVAILPNLRQTGSVLIMAGGDQSAAEAASEFLTSERWVLDLARRLGVPPDGRFPFFEVFLKTETVSNTAPSFRVLFSRAIR